jgi:hypothetical protein
MLTLSLVTIRVMTPLHVTIAAVRECLEDHQARFLFALMVLLASMSIGV